MFASFEVGSELSMSVEPRFHMRKFASQNSATRLSDLSLIVIEVFFLNKVREHKILFPVKYRSYIKNSSP